MTGPILIFLTHQLSREGTDLFIWATTVDPFILWQRVTKHSSSLTNLSLQFVTCHYQTAPNYTVCASCSAKEVPGHCWQTQTGPQGKRRVKIPFSGLSKQRRVTVTAWQSWTLPIQVMTANWTGASWHWCYLDPPFQWGAKSSAGTL